MNTESLLEVATLGRQLHLGMLYDCHNDSFIPGVYLWDMDNIQKNTIVRQSPKTSFNIHLTDSLEEKSKILQISASLSASFLAGLVTVEASASYLNNRSSSLHECRVTAQYSVKTKTEHLNMNQMGGITYKDIEDPDFSATHVVIQVEYGAEALMVFSETASDEQKKQDIQVSMKLMVKNIGLFGISAEGKVQMTDEERKKVQNFTCTFHGDFALEENPTNFEEAVKVYKSLPKLLGPNKENVVPKKVWLVPLTELVPSAPEIKHEVSKMNCIKLRNIMEQLNTAKMRANDMSKESDSIRATDITKKMKDFGENLQKYMLVWKDNLFKLLPEIRKGVEKEERLEKMFSLHAESSFGPSKIDPWLKERETELSIVKSYINDIKSRQPDVQIVAREDFDKVLFDPTKTWVEVFGFNSLGEDDPYLDSLRFCLDSEKFTTLECLPSDLKTLVKDKTPWYRSPEVSQTMRDSLDKFSAFAMCLSLSHIVSYFHYPYHAGASVRGYSKGKLLYVNILNTSEPEVVDISANTITMRHLGDPFSAKVSYKKVGDGEEAQKQVTWPVNQEILVISGLLPNTEYELEVFSVLMFLQLQVLKPFTFVTKPNRTIGSPRQRDTTAPY
ncbi:stonustoxin subunit beta-like [Colossoma macropomum]|uniref:stonustoxin subunit beta-like n=1 Tax=Colossoma macropomum TaxID=42526 RepID=UPI00186429CB|nr:stonustoxin subunit beta-like [Colossoma macropomum]XP_036438681.1 stonustoxin subunit beta-like [Colossoma macropomum]XP_036438682.1 stonustoxin subunit beta-like [Colossoma macropomum]